MGAIPVWGLGAALRSGACAVDGGFTGRESGNVNGFKTNHDIKTPDMHKSFPRYRHIKYTV